MKKIILSLSIVAVVAAAASVATVSYFSDTETSNDNTFAAGTLDLNVDGGNTNVVKFNVANMRPGNQRIGVWTLDNVGSINGYLDLENIAVSSDENGCIDPETDAGDTTCADPGDGELADSLGLDMFIDYDCDGYYDSGEVKFYSGNAAGIAGNYELDESIVAGGSVCIAAQFNWWSNNFIDDNLSQGDSMDLDITFELGQTTGQ